METHSPVDICHHCNDRMYEYLKQKIHEKIEELRNDLDEGNFEYCNVVEGQLGVLSSLLDKK